ncbi:MAG TPA: helix-hairpin-helix domain-containing protein [Abditibacteriaceae bacterium]|nr:helix-hairpin-helix domain-containing protein [Abditibacteriaceae bacterium]
MNPRSSSNPLDIDAPHTSPRAATVSAPRETSAPRESSAGSAVSGSAASGSATSVSHFFADDTRRDEARDGDQALDENEMRGEIVKTPRNGALWLLLSLIAFYSVFALGAWSQKRSSQPPAIGPFESRAESAKAKVVVHVAGAVRHPGVYTLSSNARIYEALHLAGGALPQASTDALNLADWAQDGARIEVPFKAKTLRTPSATTTPVAASETPSEATTSATAAEATAAEASAAPEESSGESPSAATQNAAAQSAAAQGVTATPEPVSPPSSTRLPLATAAKAAQPRKAQKPRRPKTATKAQSKTVAGLPRALTPDGKWSDNASPQYLTKHPLDLNKITREQLEALPGVGPSLAQKILDYRARNSGFKSVEEMDSVSGIGAKKLASLKPLLYVVAAPSAANQSFASPATAP